MKDIVYSEAEYAILMRKIEEYSFFLSNSIEKYQSVLDLLMENAIHDEQIQVKILKLKSDVSLYTERLENIRSSTKSLMLELSEEFEKADNISLPDIEMAHINAVMSSFK